MKFDKLCISCPYFTTPTNIPYRTSLTPPPSRLLLLLIIAMQDILLSPEDRQRDDDIHSLLRLSRHKILVPQWQLQS